MKSSSLLFQHHFSVEQITEVANNHLSPKTARGQDGVDFDMFHSRLADEVQLIHTKATTGSYRFTPYRQKLILKGPNSLPREISIATIRDRVTLRSINNFLCDLFPECRPQHAYPVVSRVKRFFNSTDASSAFLKLDIKSFYDEIDHKVLISCLRRRIKHPIALDLIDKAIRNPTGAAKKDAKVNEVGVPQGLSISNILSSIYLQNIDDKYSSQLDILYARYVDDILLVCAKNNSESLFNELRARLRRSRKLKVHPLGTGKSSIIDYGNPVPYLGYVFAPEVTTVRDASVKKAMTSIMRIIHGINDGNAAKSLWRMNIRISGCRIQQQDIGWMFYFSQITDHQVLHRMDAQIRVALTDIGRLDLLAERKTFMKSFREIAYNRKSSTYFPDFDKIDREGMIKIIVLLNPRYSDGIDKFTDAKVRSVFLRLMNREVREMERDTLGSFS